MSDDITFCGSECDNKKCFRHPTNIAEPRIPHSFANYKGTDICPIEMVTLINQYEHCGMTDKECLDKLKEKIRDATYSLYK